jgi:nucleoside 2-deoxyribosyltransferase
MPQKTKCFLSYAHVDIEFVKDEILPILYALNLDVWVEFKYIEWGDSIQEKIIKAIRDSDIIIAVLNGRSTYVNFELGAALGQNKPILGIIKDQHIPFDLMEISSLKYTEDNKNTFPDKLKHSINVIKSNLINKSIFKIAETKKVIGITVGIDNHDIEQELRFTYDFILLIKKIANSQNISLVQTKKGSFTSFISLDLKSWAELIEKAIFFPQEWKKRKAENLKIDAETRKIEAETKQLESQTKINEYKAKVEYAGAVLDLLEKHKELGIKVQFGDEILISLDKSDMLLISKPEEVD